MSSSLISKDAPRYLANEEPRYLANEEPRYLANEEPRYLANEEPRYLANEEPRYLANEEPRYLANEEPRYPAPPVIPTVHSLMQTCLHIPLDFKMHIKPMHHRFIFCLSKNQHLQKHEAPPRDVSSGLARGQGRWFVPKLK